MRHFIFAFFVFAFAFAFAFVLSPAQAADEPDARAILVLDASGSMWGQVDGKNKIVIAREVIADMMENWDENVHLGLSAYGHNSKGDCNDIETLIKVGPKTDSKIVEIVNGLNPKGKTPLTAAVKKAAEELKYTEEAATVILLSDGIETCDLDPCAVGKSLEEEGIDFTAHVIGFDVKVEDQAGLKCLAENTGGKFLSADNAGQLGEALEAIAEEVRSGADMVFVIVDKNGERYEKDVRYDVFAVDENDEPKGKALFSAIDDFVKIKNPGRYYVKVRVGQAVHGGQVIEVKADETQEHEIDMRGGTFNLSTFFTEGTPLTKGDVYWNIYPVKADGSTDKSIFSDVGRQIVAELPPGKFRIHARYHGAFKYLDIDSKAGETTDLKVNFEAGNVKIIPSADGGPIKNDAYWNAYPIKDNGEVEQKNRDAGVAKGDFWFVLNEGRYQIRGTLRGHKAVSFDIDVKQGETAEHTVSFEKK